MRAEGYPRHGSFGGGGVVGTLSIDSAGLTWRSLMPWRRLRTLQIRSGNFTQIEFDSGLVRVRAKGWKELVFALSDHRQLEKHLAQLGYQRHTRPSWPDRVIFALPQQSPDWRAPWVW